MSSGVVGARTARRRHARIEVLGVFALALAARLFQLLHSGAAGLKAYDQSVYYAAADALLHGQVPYRGDFVFLHPPGVAIVGLPFALLGRLTTAPVGFLAENVAFAVLGALTAAGTTVVARRAGAPAWAAVGGGIVYATWSVTVSAGSSVRLEPLGDLLLVLVIGLLGTTRSASRRQLLLAGVVCGLLVNVKLWWAVPVVLLFLLAAPVRRDPRAAALVPLAAVVTAAVVDLPFLLLSRGGMVDSVISSQLGRPAIQGTPSGEFARLSTLVRLERMTGVEGALGALLGADPADADVRVLVVTLFVCALVVLTAALALRAPLGRVAVPLLAAQTAVLLATPIYFPYYGDHVGVALALVVAAAAGYAHRRRAGAVASGTWPVAAAASLVLLVTGPQTTVPTPDVAALTRATEDVPCLVADTPRMLIAVDALDRSFAAGCRNWVDFQGVGHGGGPDPAAYVRAGRATPAWNRLVRRYLRSGDAVLLSDPNVRVFLGPGRVRRLTRGELLASTEGVVVHRTQPERTRPVRSGD